MLQRGFIFGGISPAFLAMVAGIAFASDMPWTIAPYPPESEINPVSAEMRSGDPDRISAGELQIQDWLSNGHVVVSNVWWEWFPIMMKIHHEQAIADMAAIGVGDCPPLDVTTTLLEWRIKALLVLGKPQDALEAAKSYYNVCELNQTERAVQLVGLCLNQCNTNHK